MRKVLTILGILAVFFAILTTNLIDQSNFKKLEKSISSIYEDQLVVKNIIFDLSTLVHDKELANANADSIFYANGNVNCDHKIDSLIATYEQTEMTRMEQKHFNKLNSGIKSLRKLEAVPFNAFTPDLKAAKTAEFKTIKSSIHELTEIQLEEGFREKKAGKKALAYIELFTQLEIYFLIFLAVIVIIIALSGRSKRKAA